MNEDIWDPLQDEKFLESISDNRLHVRIAAFIYRNFFEAISNFFEKRSKKWTRKFCEDNTPDE